MAREWQQTKMKEYVMPDAVYYQSIWAVRDLERMEKRVRELKESLTSEKSSTLCESKACYDISKPTERDAVELIILQERIEAIKTALSIVPDKYKRYVMSNVVMKNSGTTFPDRIWRVWKQKFLYTVAKNLSLM